jgi:DNA ligase-1
MQFSIGLASDDPGLIRYPAWAEPKCDGVRCVTLIDSSGEVRQWSRSGRPYLNFPGIRSAVAAFGLRGMMLDGEICCKTFEGVLGIAGTRGSPDDSGLWCTVWDALPMNEFLACRSTAPLRERRRALAGMKLDGHLIRLASGRMVANEAEMKAAFAAAREDGYEGLVVKAPAAPYPFGRSPAWVKVKDLITVDGRLVGLEEGRGRHAGRLGALLVDVGGVVTKVGNGLDDVLRDKVWRERVAYAGAWVEFTAQERTRRGAYRFPVFHRFREEKEAAHV